MGKYETAYRFILPCLKAGEVMAIMVKKLYKNGTFLYKMNLVAGRNGLTNLVQWVHIIEDCDVSAFLHGQELVFTAGIMNQEKDWLLNFARRLYEAGVSAFVVNIGPHTKEITKEVIDFCDEVNLPLFTIPWQTRMVDMTRDFCLRIMNSDHVESSMATTIKNIIFRIGDLETQILQMERYGYQRDGYFSFVSIYAVGKNGVYSQEYMDVLANYAEKTARSIQELYISFTYKECLILVLVDYSDDDIKHFVREFLRVVRPEKSENILSMGVSSNQQGIYNQDRNFEKALSALDIAKRKNEICSFYDKLDLYRVLYAVGDKSILRSFYYDTIGKIETYDNNNGTELLKLLRTYFENNASLQLVSEKLYIHRNTVTNQLKKIESVTGYNPLELDDRVQLYMGLYMKDMI
jgi:PucR family transcriptional regulator, proline-responsive transcriptional activator